MESFENRNNNSGTRKHFAMSVTGVHGDIWNALVVIAIVVLEC